MNEFKGSSKYVVSEDLLRIVNISIALQKPLLIKGEPGTGKTMLAEAISEALGKKLIIWNIKSTTKAQDGLYVYDTVQRLYDSQFGGEGVDDIKKYIKLGTGKTMLAEAISEALGKKLIIWNIKSTTKAQDGLYVYDTVQRLYDSQFGGEGVDDIKKYIKLGKLGEAFSDKEQVILLIDEIDKADLEFPNDLLWELDKMEFYIPETKETIAAQQRPIVIITSNAEKELPDAFLRRCVFHYIAFPDQEMMRDIVHAHYPDIEDHLLELAMRAFYQVRDLPTVAKKPSTSELLDWLQALRLGGVDPEKIEAELPYAGILLKKNEDLTAVKNAKNRVKNGFRW